MSYEFGAWQAERQNYANAMTALNQANANIRTLNRIVQEKNDRIAELEDALAVAQAEADGRLAQYQAMRDQHADSPQLAPSGKAFEDGSPKTKIRLIFEAAFDATARKMGISDPAARRHD